MSASIDTSPLALTEQLGRPPQRIQLGPLVCVALGLAAAIVVLAIVGPLFLISPQAQDLFHTLQPPFGMNGGSAKHVLGTDLLGRDLLSRAVTGLRVSLLASAAGLAIGAAGGVALGVVSGYFGGVIDEILMRVVDVQLAIPGIVFVLLIITILTPSLTTVIGVLSLITWVVFARVARAQVLALREQDMIKAIRTLGGSHLRVIVRHVLPNVAGPLIVIATVQLANLILVQAALGYLGLGVPPPTPDLGGMIADGQSQLTAGEWWTVAVPALFIVVVIGIANILGDWLRAVLDPRDDRAG